MSYAHKIIYRGVETPCNIIRELHQWGTLVEFDHPSLADQTMTIVVHPSTVEPVDSPFRPGNSWQDGDSTAGTPDHNRRA